MLLGDPSPVSVFCQMLYHLEQLLKVLAEQEVISLSNEEEHTVTVFFVHYLEQLLRVHCLLHREWCYYPVKRNTL